MQVWNKDIWPAASGQSSGVELTAWETKLLSHLIGMKEGRIPLGISLGNWSDFLHSAPVKHLKLRVLCTEPGHWSEHPSLFPVPFTDLLPTVADLFKGHLAVKEKGVFKHIFKSRDSFSGKL